MEQSVELTSNLTEPIELAGLGHSFGNDAVVMIEPVEAGRKYRLTLKALATKDMFAGGRITLDLKGAPVENFILTGFIEVRD